MNSQVKLDPAAITSKQADVSPEEWQLRVDLAAAYRLVALYGWDDLIFTHLSARIPGDEHHFLINPYGMMFDEITASSLVRVDQDGNKLNAGDFDINPAGFTIHSAIHAVREDAVCVMHTHTTAGVAVSAQKEGLLPLSQQSLFPLSGLSYHDYEGVALRDDEKARLQADLGSTNFMILRNHGLLTVGSTVADTFLNMFILQRACEIQLQALSGNRPLTPIPDGIVNTIKQQASQVTKGMGGNLAWPGLLRKLDRENPGYAD
ncbi:aldolase [Alcanivorax sp. MD8A]|uniref:Class II aldolase/adducin family protein n=1 Tax=Alcanivorax profundi TaxID=2338368 RepID=A0A418Y2E6_9GAMM|nr:MULTISPECIES: class II aldolase/adducin family protein [Alcanivorax]ERP88906.1 membrane protein [Alcanivorax sp. P2S70]PNE02866.1 aldolase [Alcanivorax sp. MD8A]RJG19685.1 class II aldolase/adducin family protein [Alcanivorax profundi]